MSKSNYWEKRLQEQADILFNKSALDIDKELAFKYRQALNETLDDITDLWDKLQKEQADGQVRPNDLYRYNRYFVIKNNINDRLKRLGLAEQSVYRRKFMNMYYDMQEIVGNYLALLTKKPEMKNPVFTMEQKKAAEKVLESVWCADGKHWSNRIWSSKDKLQASLEKGLMDCVSRGVPKDVVVSQFKDSFSSSFNDADRIVRTELTNVQNQAAKDRYKEAGIKKYKYLADIDSRTSQICQEMNGKIFLLDEAVTGVNMPPLHPYCRSTIAPVVE